MAAGSMGSVPSSSSTKSFIIIGRDNGMWLVSGFPTRDNVVYCVGGVHED
jgi:hypothetical protein